MSVPVPEWTNDSRQVRLVLHLVKEPVVDMPSEPQAGDSLRVSWGGKLSSNIRTANTLNTWCGGYAWIFSHKPDGSNTFHVLHHNSARLSHVKPVKPHIKYILCITLRHWLQVSNSKDPGSCFFASLSACSWATTRSPKTPGWIGGSVQAERKQTNNNYYMFYIMYIYI